MTKRGPKSGRAKLAIATCGPVASAPTLLPVPGYLDAVGLAEWRRITTELDAVGRLRAIDSVPLYTYCFAYSQMTTAIDTIRREGQSVLGKNGIYVNQCVWLFLKLKASIEKSAAQFGFTPAARPKETSTPGNRNSPKARFFDGEASA